MTSEQDLRERDHYALLVVDRSASQGEIRAAYARLMLQWHPDRSAVTGLAPDDAVRRTQQLNAARDELLDPARRAAYDARLELRERLQGRGRTDQLLRQEDRRARPRPQRGRDREEVHVLRSLRDVVTVPSAWGLDHHLNEPGRYRIRQRGEAGRFGGTPGDLYVTLRRSPALEAAVARRRRRQERRTRRRARLHAVAEVLVAMLWGTVGAMLLIVAMAVLADVLLA